MKIYQLDELKIEVTYECPLVCIHCSSDASPNVLCNIDYEKCISIINDASEMGVKKISFSGGEPLVYRGIEQLIKSASLGGMIVTIYTTGIVNDFNNKLEELKLNGLNNVAFSLYSNIPEEHEFITRKKGSFNDTIEAIKASIDAELGVEIHFVALKRNYQHLIGLIELARKLNVNKVSVLRFVPQGRGSLLNDQILETKQFIELKEEIQKIKATNFNLRTGSPLNFLSVNNDPICNSGLNRLLIDAELNISPCDAFKQIKADEVVETDIHSNLLNTNLRESWDKSTYLKAIRDFLELEHEEPCNSCGDLQKCLSGCLAQKVIKYGKLSKQPDPSCLNY